MDENNDTSKANQNEEPKPLFDLMLEDTLETRKVLRDIGEMLGAAKINDRAEWQRDFKIYQRMQHHNDQMLLALLAIGEWRGNAVSNRKEDQTLKILGYASGFLKAALKGLISSP